MALHLQCQVKAVPLRAAVGGLAPTARAAGQVDAFSSFLAESGINVLRDEFNIIDRLGNKLHCVFLLDLGAPGVA